MPNLVPHFILNQYEAGERNGRFPAVVLFVDISGFSTITDNLMVHGQHGSEVLVDVMRSIFDPLVQSIFDQGGFVIGYAGDAFTAVFPEGDDADTIRLRAFTAAWQMQEQMAEIGTVSTIYGTFTLSAKVGVAAGEIEWGIVTTTDEHRATTYFRGSAINGAAGAEHQCQAGDIVIDKVGFNAISAFVEAEPLPEHFRITAVTTALPPAQPVNIPPANPESLIKFVPDTIDAHAYSSEFRQVVTLFISLRNVQSETQLSSFMQTLFRLQEQYRGLLIRLDYGDKGANLLLFWGAPIAYENDIERVLNFALDLQSQTSISIVAGITYQIAHAGFIGSHLFEEYTCYGRGVNLAARFMMAAPRGEIWLDENIARQASQLFEIESKGMVPFKGFADPQPVYTLLSRKDVRDAVYQGDLVGREEELGRLAEFVQPVFQSQSAGTLIVWGEAGLGKSRLIHDFQDTAVFQDKTILWALCQTDEILRHSLNPFRYWLRRYFEQSTDQSDNLNKRNFSRKLDGLIAASEVSDLRDELDRTRSFLGALVDLHWPDSLYAQLDPKGRFENSLIGLIVLLQAESLQQPVIIHLEDAHWLDEDSVQFLQRLPLSLTATADLTYPIAIIATARPAQDFPDLPFDQELILGSLSRADLGRLTADILDGPAAPALLNWLVERVEGNPFFAEQVVRFLQEQNLLIQTETGWAVTEELTVALPTDVRAVLVARLDQLAAEVKEVVQMAAALGREFEVRLLAQMLQEESGLPGKLEQAEEAAIWSVLSQLRYLFNHALLRDAAYKMQVRARRQALHQLAAEALTAVYGDDLSPHYGELAYHTEQAGMIEQARHFLEQAGDVACAAYQNSQAIDYYGRALNLTPDTDLEAQYRLLLAREGLYDLQGKRELQEQDLSALQILAKQLNDLNKQAEVTLRRSQMALNISDYPAATAAAERAISQAQAVSNPLHVAAGHSLWALSLRQQGKYQAAFAQYEIARGQAQIAGEDKVLAQCLQGMGGVTFFQGDFDEATRYFEQALILYRQLGDKQGESVCLHSLGVVAKNLRDYTAARESAEQALDVYRLIGHQQGQGFCLTNLASIARREGEFAKAESYYKEALRNSRQTGDRSAESVCLGNLGIVACDVGNYVEAEPYLQQALSINRALGDKMGESHCLNNLGVATHDLGELAQAQAYLNDGLKICQEIGFREGQGTILNELGNVAYDLGDYQEAEILFEQALSLRRERGQTHYMAEDLVGLAQVNLAFGNLDRAKQYVEETLTYLEENATMTGAERPFRVHLICYQVLQESGDERAVALLTQAHSHIQELADNLENETLRQSFLDNVPSHREIGREFNALN